jgi:hypothetical protein
MNQDNGATVDGLAVSSSNASTVPLSRTGTWKTVFSASLAVMFEKTDTCTPTRVFPSNYWRSVYVTYSKATPNTEVPRPLATVVVPHYCRGVGLRPFGVLALRGI